MTKTKPPAAPSLVWFRNDLRLGDNPALHTAVQRGAPILCFFILEEDNGLRALGAASRWWLHHSLERLSAALEARGGRLDLFKGRAGDIVPALAKATKAGTAFWNRRYGGSAVSLDATLEKTLADDGCPVETSNGRLLNEPGLVKTKTGGSYSVYSFYWKAALALGAPAKPLPPPSKLQAAHYPAGGPQRVGLKDLALLPTRDWASSWGDAWTPGEEGARERLRDFLHGDLSRYPVERNLLAVKGTSHLSAHLRFGEISPRQVAEAVAAHKTSSAGDGAAKFMAEIGWREFDYQVMHTHPKLAEENLDHRFDRMPWRKLTKDELDAWRRGQTGYPVVDAGMRELWATGYMHNRVRMITASFLIKHLLGDWRIGEKWFWDCLCDADPGEQHDELAMGRRLRRRSLAVFPDIQPGAAGPQVRSRRRLRARPRARTRETAEGRHSRAVASRRRDAGSRRREAGQDLSHAHGRPCGGARAGPRRLSGDEKLTGRFGGFERPEDALLAGTRFDGREKVLDLELEAVGRAHNLVRGRFHDAGGPRRVSRRLAGERGLAREALRSHGKIDHGGRDFLRRLPLLGNRSEDAQRLIVEVDHHAHDSTDRTPRWRRRSP